jgi:hypothetical protein
MNDVLSGKIHGGLLGVGTFSKTKMDILYH